MTRGAIVSDTRKADDFLGDGIEVWNVLHVKVEENWAESRELYEEIGLDWVR
jgi:GTPase Era involved in 16S rRNA processing